MMNGFILMLMTVFFNIVGVIYLKKIEIAAFSLNSPFKFFTSIIGDSNLWKAILVNGTGYLFYILMINKNDISKLPSLIGLQCLGYAMVSFLRGESITLTKLISYLILVIGIILNLK